MSRSDYRRPADYQIMDVYKCDSCHRQTEMCSFYTVERCCCGGHLIRCGESYSGDSEDWDEERDNVNDKWRNRNAP